MAICPMPKVCSIDNIQIDNLHVIILAGGSGERMGLSKPKQFYQLKCMPGKCVLDLSLEFYQNHLEISKITVVSCEKYLQDVKDICKNYSKVTSVVVGGSTRQASVYEGLKKVASRYLLIHDAARPLIKMETVNNCIRALREGFEAVNSIFRPSAMMLRIENDLITQFYTTEQIAHGQCPQGFLTTTLVHAHDVCKTIDYEFKDDCSVIHHVYPKLPIYTVKGSQDGFKLTYPEDLLLLEALLQPKGN